jgi:hypothetical protein
MSDARIKLLPVVSQGHILLKTAEGGHADLKVVYGRGTNQGRGSYIVG